VPTNRLREYGDAVGMRELLGVARVRPATVLDVGIEPEDLLEDIALVDDLGEDIAHGLPVDGELAHAEGADPAFELRDAMILHRHGVAALADHEARLRDVEHEGHDRVGGAVEDLRLSPRDADELEHQALGFDAA